MEGAGGLDDTMFYLWISQTKSYHPLGLANNIFSRKRNAIFGSPRILRKELTQSRKGAKKDRRNLVLRSTLAFSLRLSAFA